MCIQFGECNGECYVPDHKPFVGLFKKKEPLNSRQTRWCLTANLFGINIKYESGKKNALADALLWMKSKEDRKVLLIKITNGNNEELLSKIKKNLSIKNLQLFTRLIYQ